MKTAPVKAMAKEGDLKFYKLPVYSSFKKNEIT